MSKVVKNVVRVAGKLFGADPEGQANAIRDAANAQAEATRQAAEKTAAAQREAAAQQAEQVRQQQAAAAAARAAAVNQATVSNQQAAAAADQQVAAGPTTPDVQLGGMTNASDPRRKYQGGQSSIGATAGGAGIRI
ncbi:hypothetical protein [Ralstonia phage vB_RsoP_BMB50]|uniref:Uncharacterized protein n=1 Tax=Ralstonia phage vB_RsoP_BMB50 TaxID=2834269 RepID=A0A8E5KHL6_9CAUD|nr:hypothetical protein [Ralstonia phage vB_RsoP_BMB50]